MAFSETLKKYRKRYVCRRDESDLKVFGYEYCYYNNSAKILHIQFPKIFKINKMSSTTVKNKIPALNKDVVCLQKGFITLEAPGNIPAGANLAYASTVQSKLMHFGYMLDESAFEALKNSDTHQILDFHNNVMDYLEHGTGGGQAFKPLYGDFPVEYMDENDATIMQTAYLYFLASGTFDGFAKPIMNKPITFESKVYTMLTLGTEADFKGIFKQLVSVNQSLLPQDLEVVKWFVTNVPDLEYPDQIPFKENLCTLGAMMVPNLPVKTPTDVLRIAVAMSGGDVSLPKVPKPMKKVGKSPYVYTTGAPTSVVNADRDKFKFKKWTRAERRYILGLLENTARGKVVGRGKTSTGRGVQFVEYECDVKEMQLKQQRWVRLAHGLHAGEYAKQFPEAVKAINMLRDNKVKIRTWYSELLHGFRASLTAGLNILAKRPGEFVRRLDWLIRSRTNPVEVGEVLNRFKIAAGGASNKVLFEVYSHFEGRKNPVTGRSVMIKGARKRTKLPDLPAIDQYAITGVQETVKDVLKGKFAILEPMAATWIDPELRKLPLPTNMRSIDPSLKPVMRGQRTSIGNPDAKVIRAFYHWFDQYGELDPDLSATFAGSGKTATLSYSGLRVGNSMHSGDVIARQGACAEYIDIDIQDAKNAGYSYVVLDVRNFRGGTLAEMNGMFGIMEREHPESNNAWVPATVSNCHALQSSASNTMISILDLETMEYIFLDIDSDGTTYARGDVNNILQVIEDYAKPPKFSVYDLLQMHVEARGKQVDKPEDAASTFELKDFTKDYTNICKWMGV